MKLRTVIATAATAAVLASSGVAIAGAATSTDTTAPTAKSAPAPSTPHAARRFKVRRLRIRRMLKGAAGVVTTAIGIDRKTLRQELRSGKTIAQIATDHGVSPQTVIDALVAAANKKIDAAVQAGKLDATRAARIEQRLPARITKLVNNWHPKRIRKHAAA
jgi:ribosomal protein S20